MCRVCPGEKETESASQATSNRPSSPHARCGCACGNEDRLSISFLRTDASRSPCRALPSTAGFLLLQRSADSGATTRRAAARHPRRQEAATAIGCGARVCGLEWAGGLPAPVEPAQSWRPRQHPRRRCSWRWRRSWSARRSTHTARSAPPHAQSSRASPSRRACAPGRWEGALTARGSGPGESRGRPSGPLGYVRGVTKFLTFYFSTRRAMSSAADGSKRWRRVLWYQRTRPQLLGALLHYQPSPRPPGVMNPCTGAGREGA